MCTETEEFLAAMMPRQRAAEQAIHSGDAGPRIALWSRNDPVTLFGAKLSATGWSEVEPVFRDVASWFTDSVHHDFEMIAAAASGDLAYVVGYEHNHVTAQGQPTTYTLRVTHVYRRENEEWHTVHRHADFAPAAKASPTWPAVQSAH